MSVTSSTTNIICQREAKKPPERSNVKNTEAAKMSYLKIDFSMEKRLLCLQNRSLPKIIHCLS